MIEARAYRYREASSAGTDVGPTSIRSVECYAEPATGGTRRHGYYGSRRCSIISSTNNKTATAAGEDTSTHVGSWLEHHHHIISIFGVTADWAGILYCTRIPRPAPVGPSLSPPMGLYIFIVCAECSLLYYWIVPLHISREYYCVCVCVDHTVCVNKFIILRKNLEKFMIGKENFEKCRSKCSCFVYISPPFFSLFPPIETCDGSLFLFKDIFYSL